MHLSLTPSPSQRGVQIIQQNIKLSSSGSIWHCKYQLPTWSNLWSLWTDSQATMWKYSGNKAELIPYHTWGKNLLAQFEEANRVHVRRVRNAWADAFVGLTASLSVPDGEVPHITVARRNLLTLLPEILPDHEPERAYSVEMATEPIEDWRISFLNFLERGRLPDVLKDVMSYDHWVVCSSENWD